MVPPNLDNYPQKVSALNEIFENSNFPYAGEKSMEELTQSSMNQGFSKNHHDLFEKYLKDIDQEIGRFDLPINKNQGEIMIQLRQKHAQLRFTFPKYPRKINPQIFLQPTISHQNTQPYLKQHNLLQSF